MTGWVAMVLSGGPVYVPTTTPTPVPTHPGVYISAPGLDIGALLGVLIPLVTVAVAILAFRDVRLNRKQDETSRRQEDAAREVHEAVEHLTEVLSARLETKENVAALRVEIARQKARLDAFADVIRAIDAKVDAVRRNR